LNRETSLYLDLWRLSAALTVFLGHVSGARFTDGFLWQFGPYMGQAVTVFFVLSGFVIGFATDRRETSAVSYVVARVARVASVALPALVATFILDAIGRLARPELYSLSWGYVETGGLWQFISGLLFINHIWFLDVPQGSDLPYWSLGYEVWYYVIFGIATFAPAGWRVAGTLACVLFVGPPIAAMFPLWLLGLLSYRICARCPPGRCVGTVFCVGSLASSVAYEFWAQRHGRLLDLAPAFLHRPELAQDYLVGSLFAMHLIGFRAVSPLFGPLLNRLAKPIRWTAGTTFTIYLFHLPVAQFLATQVPWAPTAFATRLVIVGGTLGLMFIIAEATERRKALWRRNILALVHRPANTPAKH
jgi:peptidoglycan/LPS O-acetylase OafA/YrhL